MPVSNMAQARFIMRNPDLYSDEQALDACDFVRADLLSRTMNDEQSDRDLRLTAITYALLGAGVIGFWLWAVPLIAALVQWGGQHVAGWL